MAESPMSSPSAVAAADAAAATRSATLQADGRIPILQNNVGHAGMGGPVELDGAEWDRTVASNLERIFLACKHAIPATLRHRKGTIVSISGGLSCRVG
jgi:NAD(P)-dependent dehydrogenase (short-subunit alcohol dehydrogenase family)